MRLVFNKYLRLAFPKTFLYHQVLTLATISTSIETSSISPRSSQIQTTPFSGGQSVTRKIQISKSENRCIGLSGSKLDESGNKSKLEYSNFCSPSSLISESVPSSHELQEVPSEKEYCKLNFTAKINAASSSQFIRSHRDTIINLKISADSNSVFQSTMPRSYRQSQSSHYSHSSSNNYRIERMRTSGLQFTLVSYNILAQSLLEDHKYLYQDCDPQNLEWPRRGHRILSELIETRADIICLQEVEHKHLLDLYSPRLEEYGYECVYKKKTGPKVDGCAVFYKRDLFDLITSRAVEFNQNDLDDLLNRDNVGLIVKFAVRPKRISSSSREGENRRLRTPKLLVANTHLLFNPRRTDIRLAQLRFFLSELDRMASYYDYVRQRYNHYPTILCGDFNSTPNSLTTKFILNGYLPPRYLYMNSASSSRVDTNSQSLQSLQSHSQSQDSLKEQVKQKFNCIQDRQKQLLDQYEQEQLLMTFAQEGTEIISQKQFDVATNKTSISRHSCVHTDLEDYTSLNSNLILKNPSNTSQNDITSENRYDQDKKISLPCKHYFRFKPVYPIYDPNGQPYVSSFSNCIVDYIYYTSNPRLTLISYRHLLTRQEMNEMGPIPNEWMPSDHLPLEATFYIQ